MAATVLACSPPAAAGGGAPGASATRNRSVLTTDELRSGTDQTLYDVILRLRPDWLRTRGSTSIASGLAGNTDADQIQVYQDRIHVGGPDALRQISISRATMLKFYTPGEAQQRFGNGNVNGAIEISTAPSLPPP
jgi:hypothetical protein